MLHHLHALLDNSHISPVKGIPLTDGELDHAVEAGRALAIEQTLIRLHKHPELGVEDAPKVAEMLLDLCRLIEQSRVRPGQRLYKIALPAMISANAAETAAFATARRAGHALGIWVGFRRSTITPPTLDRINIFARPDATNMIIAADKGEIVRVAVHITAFGDSDDNQVGLWSTMDEGDRAWRAENIGRL